MNKKFLWYRVANCGYINANTAFFKTKNIISSKYFTNINDKDSIIISKFIPPVTQFKDILYPCLEDWKINKEAGIIFTAPHGIKLERDLNNNHSIEFFTTFLCRYWAMRTCEISICWSNTAIEFSINNGIPLSGTRDPNFLKITEINQNHWVNKLKEVRNIYDTNNFFHIDIHGKKDLIHNNYDLDIGIEPISKYINKNIADKFNTIIYDTLSSVLIPRGFFINKKTSFNGLCSSSDYQTLTQTSVQLGFFGIQLELGYKLRNTLAQDLKFSDLFALKLKECSILCNKHLYENK